VYLPRIRIRKEEKERSSRTFTGKAMGLFLLLIVLGGLTGSFYLNQASRAATAGLQIVYLTEERERLRQENAELRRQIAEMEALSTVARRAEQLGFREREDVEYLIVDNPPMEAWEQEASASVPAEDTGLGGPRSMSSRVVRWWEELIAQLESWMNPHP
jgi:cell division protein FtsB